MAKNKLTDHLLSFIDNSPSPFHAVDSALNLLGEAGLKPLAERSPWTLAKGQGYTVIRNGSTLAAFRLPAGAGAHSAFHIITAHTDSPCLKLKPAPRPTKDSYRQWSVEAYGGVLNNSWLDRDLGVSGRITLQGKKGLESHNISLRDKKIRIPQLAIHLHRTVNEEGLVLNEQTHLTPVLGLGAGTPNMLIKDLLTAAGVAPSKAGRVLGHDLFLHDTLPCAYGGLGDEFIYAPRLDNLAMCHAALQALAAAQSPGAIPVIFLFDHEEVGSLSGHGGNSNFLTSVLERVWLALGGNRDTFLSALQRSLLVSADMAHAVHPNYRDRHDPEHMPLLGRGPVIKSNAKIRYATNSETAGAFKAMCLKAKVPFQEFNNRSDLMCGSTLGPIVSGLSGIPTVDVGSPMLSMHSAREMAGSDDHPQIVKVFKEFLVS